MTERENKFLPAAELQEMLRQHRCSPRLYRYYDREGRLAWSFNDNQPRYTYYLYNDDGEIIEIGESYINAGAMGHVVTVQQCTTKEAAEFILTKAGRDNVLRLAPDPLPEIIASAPNIEETSTVPGPASTEDPTVPSITLPPPIQLITPPLSVEETTDTTSFAYQVLAAIFSVPDQALPDQSLPSKQTLLNAPRQQIVTYPNRSATFPFYVHNYDYTTQQQFNKQAIIANLSAITWLTALYCTTSPFFHLFLQNTS